MLLKNKTFFLQMARIGIVEVDRNVETFNSQKILIEKYKNNLLPHPFEVVKADYWFTQTIFNLNSYKQNILTDSLAIQSCLYAINRCYEIKKLLYLLYKKKSTNLYTPSVSSEIPIPICNPPFEYPQGWADNHYHKLIKDTISEMCSFLRDLYKLYYPEENNEDRFDYLTFRHTYDLNLLSICVFEERRINT